MRDSGAYPLVALVILDGWGLAPPGPGNAIELAETPVFDRLWHDFPHAQLEASGPAVGLPEGQMGNSEVGHLTIGSGRILLQDLVRVNRAIETGELFSNEALRGAFERGENVHLLGLVSHGGVHSHLDHLQALLTFAPEKTWIHAFTDGRDVSPHSAVHDLVELPVDRRQGVPLEVAARDRSRPLETTGLSRPLATARAHRAPKLTEPRRSGALCLVSFFPVEDFSTPDAPGDPVVRVDQLLGGDQLTAIALE